MTINFNIEPYNDDFLESKHFHRILFKPGYAVQARELTQLQTILQNQIERFGNSVYKNGAMVIPGQIKFDQALPYIKLKRNYGQNNSEVSSYLDNFLNKTIVGSSSGVKALVVQVAKATATDEPMLFVKYISGGFTGESKFLTNETLSTVEDNQLDSYSVTTSIAASAMGTSSAAILSSGVFFINGFFVHTPQQTIILGKFSNKPTFKVGILINESIIESEDDESLLDNAIESFNSLAPGADRYSISLELTKLLIDEIPSKNFIELMRVESGNVTFIVDKSDLSTIGDTLARRTFDESGHYTVRPFGIHIAEYRNNNRGTWTTNTPYLQNDIVDFRNKTYYAYNSGISKNVASIDLDDNIIWVQTTSPKYNSGIFEQKKTLTEQAKNADNTLAYNEDGSPVLTTRDATLTDMQKTADMIAVGIDKGKAYVYGYEIEKLATTYVPVEKSRDKTTFSDVLISPTYGNYIYVKNVHAIPNITALDKVELWSRYTVTPGVASAGATKVGTARIRSIKWDSGDASGPNAVFKVFLFDIDMSFLSGNSGPRYSFNSFVKQIVLPGPTATRTFTCDAVIVPKKCQGSLVFNSNSTTVKGSNSRFLTDFAINDYILVNSTPFRITSITDNLTMSVDNTVPAQNGTEVLKCDAVLNDSQNTSLIFQLPNKAVSSLTKLSYFVTQSAVSQLASSSGQITLSAQAGSEFANPDNRANYILFSQNSGEVVSYTATRSQDNRSITFKVPPSFYSTYLDVIYTLQRDLVIGEKYKTLKSKTIEITDASKYTSSKIFLDEADGLSLKSIKMRPGTGGSSAYSVDITTSFDFHSGQTDSYYGLSFLTKKQGKPAPSNSIQITYEYYEHSSGDFFSVNSYEDYSAIPKYNSYQLRDAIDFRPRCDSRTDGIISFSGFNDYIPTNGQDFILTYSSYMPRITKISLNKNGEIVVLKGVSSLDPKEPKDSDEGMTLYTLYMQPYTFSTSTNDVNVKMIENKRYTMRDIGKIEKRIDTLEYYTSLSLLEQDTKNMSIKDEDGFDRYKNGFFVDNFKTQLPGDVNSPDYSCSIDPKLGALKPFVSMESVAFTDINSNNTERSSKNYKLTGDIISLPYTEVPLINQPKASSSININPFAVFTFNGKTTLTPQADHWFETTYRPDIIVNVEGNYSAIKAVLERTGVLGTVWNSWETQWSGTVNTVNHNPNVDMGFGKNIGKSVTTTRESRTGINTSVDVSISYETADDKIVETALIPYCRKRNILVQAFGLKPNTKFYPFFDSSNISPYIKFASKITVTSISGKFDTTTNVGSDYKSTPRMFSDNSSETALNIGDIITGQTSGCTAILVGIEEASDGNTYFSFCNMKPGSNHGASSFIQGEQLIGSISNATCQTSSGVIYSDSLTSNSNGSLEFLFEIPNSDVLRFRTGTRVLSLLDTPKLDFSNSSSSASTRYFAEGFLQSRQQTINAVRNANVVTENLSESRTTVTAKPYDPLAQTFFVESYSENSSVPSPGCFLTSVEVYFEKKDQNIPVTLQVRPVVNGYPSSTTILPFGEVTLKPSSVNISADASVPTVFSFPSPVFVANMTEYCVVLLADSIEYKAWISVLGEKDTISKTFIDKQPSLGSLFISQNASTWSAEQLKDLKLKVNRAKFSTNVIGSVEFENTNPSSINLKHGDLTFTNGSSLVRVFAPNHGLTVGSKFTIQSNSETAFYSAVTQGNKNIIGNNTSLFTENLIVGDSLYTNDGSLIGIVASISSDTLATLQNNSSFSYSGLSKKATPVYDIPVSSLFKQQIATTIEYDYFVFDCGTISSQSGFAGEGISISRNVQFDMFVPNLNIQTFDNTSVTPYMSCVTGETIGGSQVSMLMPSEHSGASLIPILIRGTNFCDVPRMILNKENTLSRPRDNKALSLSQKSNSSNSSIMKFDIFSADDTISPIIDSRSVNLICLRQKIGLPNTSINTNIDRSVVYTGQIIFSSTGYIETSTNIAALEAGQIIEISGSAQNNNTFKIKSISDTKIYVDGLITNSTAPSATITSLNRYFDDIKDSGSSSICKYVTSDINLSNSSTFLKIRLSANCPMASNIRIFFKTKDVASLKPMNEIPYIEYLDFQNMLIKTDSSSFVDYDIDIENIPDFDGYKIKIVYESSDSTYTPTVHDLRVIACA